jgi:hypothetical protein
VKTSKLALKTFKVLPDIAAPTVLYGSEIFVKKRAYVYSSSRDVIF